MRRFTRFDPHELGLDVRGFSGNEAICCCPFHDDHDPSGSLNLDNGLWFCFSCGAISTAYKIATKLGGFVSSAILNIPKNSESYEWQKLLSFPLAIDNPYLALRGVSNEMVEQFHIHAMPSGIVFEMRGLTDRPEAVYIRQYDGDPRYIYFGKPLPFWPMQEYRGIEHDQRVYLTEGIFGALRARSADLLSFAALGAIVRRELANYFADHKLYGCFDDDFAGYTGGGRLITLCPNAKILLPGLEWDELEPDAWRWVDKTRRSTRSLRLLSTLSGDRKKFFTYLPNR